MCGPLGLQLRRGRNVEAYYAFLALVSNQVEWGRFLHTAGLIQ